MLDKTDIIPSSVLEIEVGETEQTAKQHLHPINQIPFLAISHRQCESVSSLFKKIPASIFFQHSGEQPSIPQSNPRKFLLRF